MLSDAILGQDEYSSIVQERWSAHVEDWAKQLTARHTIVTFNYDRALERIGAHLRKHGGQDAGPVVLLPSEVSKSFPKQPRVLKLHGSVDWKATLDGIERAKEDFALTARDEQLVIATPGPTKSKVTKDLEPLWTLAENSIEQADAVVLVGYRFPPTDAVARKRILGAIERRTRGTPTTSFPNTPPLALHVVLGPNSPDAPRLVELLRFAAHRGGMREDDMPGTPIETSCYRVRAHQLFSQDFFTVYKEDLLLQ